MNSSIAAKRWLLVMLSLILCVATLSACVSPSSSIAPSVENLAPMADHNGEYIPKPPVELGELLFSYNRTEAEKQAMWSECIGRWVIWSGTIYEITPTVKPDKIVFIYGETQETPPFSTQFAVEVKFDSKWTEQLKGLSADDRVYYRAKLIKYQSGLMAGVLPESNVIILTNGSIVSEGSIEAKLVDLAYAGCEQLDRLEADMESLLATSDYFSSRYEHNTGWWLPIKAVLGLAGMQVYDSPLVEEKAVPIAQQQKARLKADIENRLKDVLGQLDAEGNENNAANLADLDQKILINEKLAAAIDDVTVLLTDMRDKDRQSIFPGTGGLLRTMTGKLETNLFGTSFLSVASTVEKIGAEYYKLSSYSQIICSCYITFDQASTFMDEIHANVIEAMGNISES